MEMIFQWLMIGTVVSGIIVVMGNVVFNFKPKTLARLFMVSLLAMIVYGSKAAGDEAAAVGFFTFVFVMYVLYVLVFGVIGWIFNFLTGGEKLTVGRVAMFVLGWVGAGKVLDWEKRNKAEHEMRMKQGRKQD